MRAPARPPVILGEHQVWRTPTGTTRTVIELVESSVPLCRCRRGGNVVMITQSSMRSWILRQRAELLAPTLDMTNAATALLDMIAMAEPRHRVAVLVFDPERDDMPIVYSNAAAMDLQPALATSLALVADGTLRMPVAGGVRWVGEEDY